MPTGSSSPREPSNMFDMFQYAFMQRAFIAGAVLGVAVPLVGVIMVLKRLSMIGDTLSHASLAGVAGGLIAGINPVAGATVACLAAACFIEGIRNRLESRGDLAIAIVMATGVGLAGVLSGFVPNSSTFSSFLFGSIVTVSDTELATIVVIGLGIIAYCALFSRELFWVALDERAARIAGVRTRLVNVSFIFICALVISIAARTVGALIVSSMMTVPVACALAVSRSWRQTCAVSSAVGLASVIVGLTVSYVWGLKPGGTIVLIQVAMLIALYGGRALLDRWHGRRRS